MSEAFGIKTKDDGPEEKFGDDRLGVNSLFGNIGITVVLIILVLFVLTIIVYFTNRCIKRSKFSQKSKERIKLLCLSISHPLYTLKIKSLISLHFKHQ